MKLWKILLATLIATILVCGCVALAEEAEEVCPHIPYVVTTKYPTCTEGSTDTWYVCSRPDCKEFKNKTVWYEIHNDNALDHEAVFQDTKPATCAEEGYHLYKCGRTGCKHEWKVTIKKLDHNKALYTQLSTPATCTTDGVNWYKCKDCDADWTEVAKALKHSFTIDEPAKAANCHEDGYTRYKKCANEGCDAVEGKVVIPANDQHTNDYEVLELYVAPTCLATGTKHFHCADCGARWTKTVEKAAHKEKDVEYKPATCTEDGYTAHLACETKGCDWTYGKTVIPASGSAHNWKYNGKVEATCEKGGYEMDKCTVCGEYNLYNKVDAKGHNFSVVLSSKDASCTEKGWTKRLCATCSTTKDFEIAKLAHTYVENGDMGWKTVVEPKCDSEGRAERKCTVCKDAPELKAVAALGHKLGSGIVVKPATCTTAGEKLQGCTNGECKYEVRSVIPATNHKDAREVEVAAATCTLPGMKHIFCDACNKYIETNIIIAPTNHKDAKITVTKAATCTAEGERVVECKACGKITEKIAKLAHKYEWITTPATPSANGKSEYKCACGDVKETKTVKYTKWYYNNTITSFGPTTKELVGGNDWYRVTPVDLTVDGVYTYDLIASNKYIVGTATITVNAGTLTVSYKTKANVDVKDEALLIYASKADLATGTAVTAPVGAAINAAETFGADTKVLVSLVLTGDYDAAGKGLVDASAAAGMIANID